MDFESLITFLFIFFFFILPALLKRAAKKKKKINAKPGKPSLKKRLNPFSRLGDLIQDFLRELEEQAKKAKAAKAGTAWEQLDDREEADLPVSPGDADFQARDRQVCESEGQAEFEPGPAAVLKPQNPRRLVSGAGHVGLGLPGQGAGPSPAGLPSGPVLPQGELARAVALAEILGKPKALD